MQNVDTQNADTKYYLGEQDADKEWNDDSRVAKKFFLQTATYQSFIQPSSLILLGRTGTGKTAILRCLEQEIEQGEISEYKQSIRLSFQDILKCIPEFDAITTSPKLYVDLVDSLEMIINLRIMKKVYDKLPLKSDLKLRLSAFLESRNIKTSKREKVIRKIQRTIEDAAKMSETTEKFSKGLTVFGSIIKTICTDEYEDLIEDVYDYLKKAPMLVLIDTMDRYDMSDARLVTVVKALVSVSFKYFNNNNETHTAIKLTLPSEIYTKIVHSLPGKQQGNTTVIQWAYKDLLSLIALRIKWWRERESEESELFKFIDSYSVDSLMENTSKAKEVLHHILPDTCTTSLNFKLDTLAYIIRHTLKKPRELMAIFNAIIHKIIHEGKVDYFLVNEQRIKDVVHSKQEELILSALSMYETSYEKIGVYIEELLSNRQMRFPEIPANDIKELNAKLKASSLQYDAKDVIRVLVESGLLGKINKQGTIAANNSMLCNADPITVLTAVFEYQIKGTLNFAKNDEYVIHPMCYEHFTCYVDDHTLVYPEKSDNDGDNVYMDIVEQASM